MEDKEEIRKKLEAERAGRMYGDEDKNQDEVQKKLLKQRKSVSQDNKYVIVFMVLSTVIGLITWILLPITDDPYASPTLKILYCIFGITQVIFYILFSYYYHRTTKHVLILSIMWPMNMMTAVANAVMVLVTLGIIPRSIG